MMTEYQPVLNYLESMTNQLVKIRKRISDVEAQPLPRLKFTAGSVLFAGTSGYPAQDNTKLFWEDTNNRLGIGNATPRVSLDVTGQILSTDVIRAEGYTAPPTGEGLELGYTSATGFISAFKRTDSTYKPLVLRGTDVTLQSGVIPFLIGSDVLGTQLITNDAITTGTSNTLILSHHSTGAVGNNFGSDFFTIMHTTGNTDRAAHLQRTIWPTAADATRKARTDFFIYDTLPRLALRLEANGTVAMLGFLGASAVIRQVITGVRTGTLAQLQTVMLNLLTGLQNFGLITDSTT